MDLGNDNSLEPLNEISIEMQVYLPESQSGNYNRIISKKMDIPDFYCSYHIITGSQPDTRNPSLYVYTEDGTDYLSPPNYQLSIGWHSVSATYDGELMKLYWDGLKVAEYPHTGQLLYDDNPLYIAKGEYYSTIFLGQLKSLRIWSRALLEQEIQQTISYELPSNVQG